jgi:hypothetical protein
MIIDDFYPRITRIIQIYTKRNLSPAGADLQSVTFSHGIHRIFLGFLGEKGMPQIHRFIFATNYTILFPTDCTDFHPRLNRGRFPRRKRDATDSRILRPIESMFPGFGIGRRQDSPLLSLRFLVSRLRFPGFRLRSTTGLGFPENENC